MESLLSCKALSREAFMHIVVSHNSTSAGEGCGMSLVTVAKVMSWPGWANGTSEVIVRRWLWLMDDHQSFMMKYSGMGCFPGTSVGQALMLGFSNLYSPSGVTTGGMVYQALAALLAMEGYHTTGLRLALDALSLARHQAGRSRHHR